MLSSQDRQFYKFFLIVATTPLLVLADFFFEKIFSQPFTSFWIFSLHLFSQKNAKFREKNVAKCERNFSHFFSRFSRNVSFAGNSSQYLSVQCSLSSYPCLHMHLTVDTPEVSIIDVCILSRREDGE